MGFCLESVQEGSLGAELQTQLNQPFLYNQTAAMHRKTAAIYWKKVGLNLSFLGSKGAYSFHHDWIIFGMQAYVLLPVTAVSVWSLYLISVPIEFIMTKGIKIVYYAGDNLIWRQSAVPF